MQLLERGSKKGKEPFLPQQEDPELGLKEVGLELESSIKCRTTLLLGQGQSDVTSPETSQNTQFCIMSVIKQI